MSKKAIALIGLDPFKIDFMSHAQYTPRTVGRAVVPQAH